MLVILWTDGLLFLLMLSVTVYAVYAARREHLRAPWRRVVRGRAAAMSAVVLAAYVVVALLDSAHFHAPLDGADAPGERSAYSAEVVSLFDVLVAPLRRQTEKTYSAPFATHLYSKEAAEGPDGQQVRIYPRLAYGGAHLADPDGERMRDILVTSGRAFAEGLALSAAGAVLLLLWLARVHGTTPRAVAARIGRGETRTPWLTVVVTAAVVVLIAVWVARLGVKYHILGTDKVGQDVLYQALKSIRTGLVIGTLTTLVMLPFALALGIMAGYFRGWVDDVVQYVYTTLNSIPSVLLIAAAILMIQVYMANHPESFGSVAERADLRLLFLCIILGITSWTGLCRLLRGEALKLSNVDYIEAAVAFGVSHATILVRHILPNVMHIVLITVVLDFSALVLAEAVLSYINIGVDPSTHSWGNMINSARLEMAREPVVWWSLAAALVFMFTLVLAANLFADAVRDAFDPRLRKETT
ncbi:MAG: ABC transporter permease [Gammaproteobacteria bacterium]|nr:ABC transporter permease [Gammaproteobacteria bacterium]NIR82869.1 ABC transporter permease [Gammaproteobacteria bacterium]NIR89978.1 ABC transporter permease [Gammaproteobacteria bacterium]NIU04027.1 ABC transporter permease [Gammaproteobacteria bacterium]NIV51347.1 ABC transporter permease subunit [Gammaproteobacteria bacterium]